MGKYWLCIHLYYAPTSNSLCEPNVAITSHENKHKATHALQRESPPWTERFAAKKVGGGGLQPPTMYYEVMC